MSEVTTTSGAIEVLRAQAGNCAQMLLRWMALSDELRRDPVVVDFIEGHCERIAASLVGNPDRPHPDTTNPHTPRVGGFVSVSPDALIPKSTTAPWVFWRRDTTTNTLGQTRLNGLWIFNVQGSVSEHERRALSQELGVRYDWETSAITKAVKAILQAHTRGIKWSVTKGSGTASTWITIRGDLIMRRGFPSTQPLTDALEVARQRLGLEMRQRIHRAEFTGIRPNSPIGGFIEDNTLQWSGKSGELVVLNQLDLLIADRAVGVNSPLGRILAQEAASGGDLVLLTGDEVVVLFVTHGLKPFARSEAYRQWKLTEARVKAAQLSLANKGLMNANRAISKAGRSEERAIAEQLGLGQFGNARGPWRVKDGKVMPLLVGRGLSEQEKVQQRLLDAAETPTFPAQFARVKASPKVGTTALTLTWREDDGLFIEGDTKAHKTAIKAWVPKVGARTIGGKWAWGGRRRQRWLRTNTLGATKRAELTDSMLRGWAEELAAATGAIVTARRQNEGFSFNDEIASITPDSEAMARRASADKQDAEKRAFKESLHINIPWPLSDEPASTESIKTPAEGSERWQGWRALFVAGFGEGGKSRGIPNPVLIERIDHGGRTFTYSVPGRSSVKRGHVEGIVALWPKPEGQGSTDPKKLLQVLHLRIQVSSIRREALARAVSAAVRGVLGNLKGRLDVLEKEARGSGGQPINDQRDLLDSDKVATSGLSLGGLPIGKHGWVQGLFFYPVLFEQGRRPKRRTVTEWFLPIQRLVNGNLKGLHIERTQGGGSWRRAVMLSWEPHFIARVSPDGEAMSVHPRQVPVPVWLATRQWQPARRR